ncbi:hypothetical protein SSX86_028789 [Deinandra increscens subsp. villosa]|uniref:BHLH domain-containing protein n=1 Tax=Deinandra increscens subsp. villosa TaxID=3103831 RepID=A0AAP0CA31_9ASTR
MEFPPKHGFTWSQEYLLKEMMTMMMREGSSTSSSSCSSSSPMVALDSERGLIMRRPADTIRQKADKALIALRNHSEAERRRRERINGHLSVLRSLIPGTTKMDKASLLAEVISNLKELRKTATKASNGLVIPMDIDQVKVEPHNLNVNIDESSSSSSSSPHNNFYITASLCCEYTHQVLSDLKEALDGLNLKTTIIRTEIATLGSRIMMNLNFLLTKDIDQMVNIKDVVTCVDEALKSVLDKFYASQDLQSEANSLLSNKRRRLSFFTPSNSSSFW